MSKKKFPPKDPSAKRKENDVSWYVPDNDMLRFAAQVSFAKALGSQFNIADINPTLTASYTKTSVDGTESVPGIMVLRTQPCFGVAHNNPNAPVNLAARELFTKLRYTLSSNLVGIEAPDVMCYLIAMDSIMAFQASLNRVYGLMATYSSLNRYYVRAFVEACGFDFDDLNANLGNFRYFLRQFTAKVNRGLRVPKGLGIYARHQWLFSHVFSDSPVEKSQTYIHVPFGFYTWNPTKYTTGSAAVWKSFDYTQRGVAKATLNDIITYSKALLDPMLADDDVANISGIILRAYGDDGCETLPEIDESYSVEPVYSEEILGQIHNTEIAGFSTADATAGMGLDYQQVTSAGYDNYLEMCPTWNVPNSDKLSGSLHNFYAHYMDSFVDQPSAEEIMINSRDMYVREVTAFPTGGSVTLTNVGLDIVVESYVVAYGTYGGTWKTKEINICGGFARDSMSLNPAQVLDLIKMSGCLAKFDWAPRFFMCLYTTTSPLIIGGGQCIWDFNNTAIVDDTLLTNLHEVALLGALGIPGKVSAYKQMSV